MANIDITIAVGLIFMIFLFVGIIIAMAFYEIEDDKALRDAEWYIADVCNSCLKCEDCKKWMKDSNECYYKKVYPGKWGM